ncbi:MAG: esterase family protein [Chitinophagaceae bacterium]|nr:esterase family protein [Chitinophagaceae bacterium]
MKYCYWLLLSFFSLSLHAQVKLTLKLDSAIHRSLTGRLYIYTQSDTSKPIPNDPDPSQPMFAFDLKGWQGNHTVVLSAAADHMPRNFQSLKPGFYKVAGIIDTDFSERGNFNPGSVYARKEAIVQVQENGEGYGELLFNSVAQPRRFRENDSTKEVVVKSKLLSDFRKQDIWMKAAVRLPASYQTDSTKQYPLVLIIPGWGGTHYDLMSRNPEQRYGMRLGQEKIYVLLNPESQSPFGLHAFVDSRVNGPWGKALVEELIPYLQERFRINPNPEQHLLTGQSTGGYGVLWLQMHYPQSFGGCWAVSPDPVDFSAFVGINLYEKGVNFYTDRDGKARPFFMMNGQPLSTMREMMEMEAFNGDGEQQQAFEAEFGIPDAKGRPQPLFDRVTGLIDPTVVETWKAYDMTLVLQRDWSKLAAQLSHKIHVYAGGDDNFFLNKAVDGFAAAATKLKAAVVAENIPGANHFNIWSPVFTKRVVAEMDERLRQVKNN